MKRVELLDAEAPSEASMTRALIHSRIFHRAIIAVPCCGWAGHETDLLVIEKGLRIIDVEVKISRADLRADIKKDKWWKSRPWSRHHYQTSTAPERTRREWPERIWKHYYAMPSAMWTPALLDAIPAVSGVLLIAPSGYVKVMRMAKPNRDAKPISAADAVDVARLAGLRMWDALVELHALRNSRKTKK